jgi:hypothetical protein
MKPVLAFVLGMALAGGVGFLVVHRKRDPGPPPQVTTTTIPSVSAMQQPATSTQPAVSSPEPAAAPGLVSRPPITTSHVSSNRTTNSTAARRGRNAGAEPVRVAQVQPPAPVPVPVQNVPQPPVPQASAPVTADIPKAAEDRNPAPREPHSVTVPAGTLIYVRVEEALSSDRSFQGDAFRASLAQPLVVDGFVIAERGARVTGKVVDVDKGGRVKGVSHLSVQLTQLSTSDGQRVAIQTETFAKDAASSRKTDAEKIGGGAAIGAIIGAIAGGGKGAAIGAGVGGGAGAGDVLLTHGKAAEIPVETKLTFRLRDQIVLTERLAAERPR